MAFGIQRAGAMRGACRDGVMRGAGREGVPGAADSRDTGNHISIAGLRASPRSALA